MCGLAGVVNLNNSNVVPAQVRERMTEVLSHRGPDDVGYYQDSPVSFGQRRLIIIDLSPAGQQPMFDIDEQASVVFNREICSYGETRDQIRADGHRFKSRSDTKVIRHALLKRGVACVNDFIGIFAFALYEKKRGKLIY